MAKNQINIGNYLLNRLHDFGVNHIFGLPGDYILGFDKLIEKNKNIQFINTTRENTAGYLADAYARIRGLGVACITYGVGINITNALAQAYVESSPLVLISGAAGTEEFLHNPILHHLINKSITAHSDSTQLEIFKQVTIAQTVLNDPNTAASEIERVLFECITHKKPVYIEIPRNQVYAAIASPLRVSSTPKPSCSTSTKALTEVLEETTRLLKQARHPIIWAGHLIQRFGLSAPLLQFAEKYQIPIVTTLLGKAVIDEHHPLFAGIYQGGMSRKEVKAFVEKSDCTLILGALMNDVDTGIFTAKMGKEHTLFANPQEVTIDNHLYPHISLVDYIEALTTLNFKPVKKPKIFSQKDLKPFQPKPKQPISILRTFECLQKHLGPEILVVSDMGDCLLGSVDLKLSENGFISNAHFASIGFGTPAAIGAQIAAPKKRVIGIVGDGAFQMTAMELSTAVRYQLDPIIIVLNNHGYGTERPLLEGEFNNIVDWNYTAIPKVLGKGIGIHVKTEEELDKAVKKALGTRGQYFIIEVELDKTDFSPALLRLGKLIRGRIKGSKAKD